MPYCYRCKRVKQSESRSFDFIGTWRGMGAGLCPDCQLPKTNRWDDSSIYQLNNLQARITQLEDWKKKVQDHGRRIRGGEKE